MPFLTIARAVPPITGTNIVLFSSGDELLEIASNSGTNLAVLDNDGDVVTPAFMPNAFLTSPTLLTNGDILVISSSNVVRYDQAGSIVDQTSGFTPGPGRTVELANGNILVTYNDAGGDLRGQLLTPSLDLIGSNFLLATAMDYTSDVSALAGGGFAVLGSNNTVPASLRAFDANGIPLGPPSVLNGYASGDIQALSDGGYVAFTTRFVSVIGEAWYDSFVQFYNADGTARTAQTFLGQLSIGHQQSLSVVSLDNDLVVVGFGSHAQLYHSSGRALGDLITIPVDSLTAAEGIDADTFASIGKQTSGGPTELLYWQVDRPNILIGTANSESFDGAGATDRIMAGFGGNDVFSVDSAGDIVHEWAGEGNDTVIASISYQLRAGSEVELVKTSDDAGTTALNLTGNEFAQTIRGNAGDNWLTGGGGGDTLIGLGGNDFYFVGNAADVVQEAVGGGTDRIFASTSYALAAGVEVEMMTTNLNAGTTAINLTGNELVQAIIGNAGANQLNGGGGADTLIGLGGNDFYFIVDGRESVIESAGGGSDRVFTSVDYQLQAGASVETISTNLNAGTAPIHIIGNELAQTIFGNNGDNQLTGGGGGDVLVGNAGNDFFFVNDTRDVVVESAGGGTDRVFASLSYTLSSGAEVELLSTDFHAGTAAINFTGNELAQSIFGNAGSNTLDGGAGKDVLYGYGGADIFLFSTALNTAAGAGSFASLAATANVDQIGDFSADDKIGLDHTRFGLPAGALAAGAFVQGTAAMDSDDRIIYDQTTGALLYDADGNGAGAAQLFAYVSGSPSLDASHFVVI